MSIKARELAPGVFVVGQSVSGGIKNPHRIEVEKGVSSLKKIYIEFDVIKNELYTLPDDPLAGTLEINAALEKLWKERDSKIIKPKVVIQ